jgi:hypothetical protein
MRHREQIDHSGQLRKRIRSTSRDGALACEEPIGSAEFRARTATVRIGTELQNEPPFRVAAGGSFFFDKKIELVFDSKSSKEKKKKKKKKKKKTD